MSLVVTNKHFENLKQIKTKFRALPRPDREALGVSLLKVNLGVNDRNDLDQVRALFGDSGVEAKIGTLANLIDYLHAAAEPKDFSSLVLSLFPDAKPLPAYTEDEIDTLKEGTKPFSTAGKNKGRS